jgi:phosphohistidine phosphatase
MRIYLVQHGLAEPKDVDPDRPLSEEGRRDVQRLAELLGRSGIRVRHTVHSGKTRAAQTASLLAEHLLPADGPRPHAGLNPNDPVEPMAAEVEQWSADTLVVGHLPFLGRLVSLLVTGDPDRPTIALQPGSGVCLERDPEGRWLLLWMVRPELVAAAPE